MAGPQPGVRTQRFELLDPTDVNRVIQPADVVAGVAKPHTIYRVRAGIGAGRVAAGVPLLLENATMCATNGSPRRATHVDHGERQVHRRWLGACVAITTILLVLVAGLLVTGMGQNGLSSTGSAARPDRSQQLAQPLISVDASGRLHLEPDALETLRSSPGPVCVLGVAGPAGEGSSTLADALASSLGPSSLGAPPSELRDARGVGWQRGHQMGEDAEARSDLAEDAEAAMAGPRAGRTSFLLPEGNGAEGVRMWANLPPTAELADVCESVMVLDSSAITGRTLQPAWARFDGGALDVVQHRLLSFMMLTTSRLALNMRRQPKRDVLERALGAAITTLTIRPATTGQLAATGTGDQLVDSACFDSQRALLAPSCTAPSDALPPPAAVALRSPAAAELVIVLRDTHHEPWPPTHIHSMADAFREWLPGGAADVLEAATAPRQLMSIVPPAEYELEILERTAHSALAARPAAVSSSTPSATTGFMAALSEAAGNLTRDLQPLTAPGGPSVADGNAVAAWMQHVVWKLNEEGSDVGYASA